MFRYGAVELVGLVKCVQQLSGLVERPMGTGHSLVHCRSRCLYLGPYVCVTVWLVLQRALADPPPHGLRIQIKDRADQGEGEEVGRLGRKPLPCLARAARAIAAAQVAGRPFALQAG